MNHLKTFSQLNEMLTLEDKLKISKFTFKMNQPTGKWRSFDQWYCDIKLLGKQCGTIHEEGLRISFFVKIEPTKEKPAPFKTITLKYTPTTLEEAKEYLNTNKDRIMKSFDLYLFSE